MTLHALTAVQARLGKAMLAIGLISAIGSPGCAILNRATGGRLPAVGSSGDSGSGASAASSSSGGGSSASSGDSSAASGGAVSRDVGSGKPRHVPPPSGREAQAGACTGWYTGVRSELDAMLADKPEGLEQAKSLAQRWKSLQWQPSSSCDCNGSKVAGPDGIDVVQYTCRDAELSKKINEFEVDLLKAEHPVGEKVVRAALTEDVKWARGQMFDLFRLNDRVPNEALRTLGRDVAKAYEATLTPMFKTNGGLGKKDNGEVMCVYSSKPLPAGGKGSTGFQTHFDGPGTIHVGCRLQGPAEGQSGNIILYWNADTGPMERMLNAVELGASYTLGKKDWVTGSFKLPAGEDFAKTVHYTFDARVVVRNVWKEETVLSSAVLTWHK
ncbi:MAG: hypothetical protein HY902_21240 [Deltaproteobacteria bacterium]|nr:hypothetical protein [Deltaproteobacteria bacterium]